MVRTGRVRALDKAGSDLADKAAGFGRRRLPAEVIDSRRCYLAACSDWFPPVYDLYRYFIAIAGAVVNEVHGGSATHPIVWDRERQPKRRRVLQAVREFAWVLCPPDLWRHGSVWWPAIHVDEADVAAWPYSAAMLVKLCAFLSSLHCPAVVGDLEMFGISYVELLALYERWAGERLVLEPTVPRARRGSRPISVSAVPAGPSIDIRRSCRFLGSMLRALGQLPGGLGRFIPCRFGANHCRLCALEWEQYGHGLTSTPHEAIDTGFLDDLLVLFGYPADSGESLVAGTLRRRYCQVSFAAKKPTWGMPLDGRVAASVTAQAGSVGLADVQAAGVGASADDSRVVQAGVDWKRIRLTKKTPVFHDSSVGKFRTANPQALEASSFSWRSFWGFRYQEGASGIGFGRTSWDWPKFLGLGSTVPRLQVRARRI